MPPLPSTQALNRSLQLGLINNPSAHVPVMADEKDGRAPCPVCAIMPATHVNKRKIRRAHHPLAQHIRLDHPGWDNERMAQTWPAFWADLKSRCTPCRNASSRKSTSAGEKLKCPARGAFAPKNSSVEAMKARILGYSDRARERAQVAESAGLALVDAMNSVSSRVGSS